MLVHLFDRLCSPTVVYLVVVYVSWTTTHTSHPTIAYGFLLFSTFYLVWAALGHLREERQIRKLGDHAPVARTWTPFNAGVIGEALWYFHLHRNHEWWWKMFRKFGNPERPHTAEAFTLWQRFIFTADEENIKAILATQFQDYGKGPQFREEWRDFLGLSEAFSGA